MAKFCLLSDIHLAWNDIDMPDADYCIIAGDALNTGDISELLQFNKWLKAIKSKYKQIYLLPGNHDKCIEKSPDLSEMFLSAAKIVAEGERLIGGKRIYFCSYVPSYGPWAFMRSEKELKENHYSRIPEGLDMLVCHGPPRYVLDQNKRNDHCGSQSLRDRLIELRCAPKLMAFGHIHTTDDQPRYMKWQGIDCYNVSIMDDYYDPVHRPTVVSL